MILIKNKNKNKKGQKNVKISEATSKDLLIDESLESQYRDWRDDRKEDDNKNF